MSTCGHTELLARDFANQPQPLSGPCMFCQRDELLAALRRARRQVEIRADDLHMAGLRDASQLMTAHVRDIDALIAKAEGRS